ncbi:hypothetical protein, partial [Desulfogranum marinum]|uniref:hypothetical protein n=1 Tax=Desulfogranum marinum TaxID=453220 RepID=UPI0019669D47
SEPESNSPVYILATITYDWTYLLQKNQNQLARLFTVQLSKIKAIVRGLGITEVITVCTA